MKIINLVHIPSESIKKPFFKDFEIIFLSAGLVLTTCTQLRISSSIPIGIGEMIVLIWSIYTRLKMGTKMQLNFLDSLKMNRFWLGSMISFVIGYLISLIYRSSNPTGFAHDFLAFCFSAFFAVTFVGCKLYREKANDLMMCVIVFAVSPMLIMLYLPQLMPFVDPWYQASRFQGWATNPHQIGLLINPLPFICCYFFGQSKSFWNKVFIASLFAGIISIGIATKSDSLMVSWTVTSFLLFNLIFWRAIERSTSATYGIHVVSIMKVLKVFVGIIFVSLIINQVYGEQIFDAIEDVSSSENNQGDGRKELWTAGLEVVKSFPLFGLGPGSHISSVANAIGEEGFAEAHNSFIDWSMAGGLFALFFYLAFLLFVVKRIWNNHNYALFICAFLSIIVMSLFGFFLRHTIFWFYMAMFLAMTLPNQDTKQTFK